MSQQEHHSLTHALPSRVDGGSVADTEPFRFRDEILQTEVTEDAGEVRDAQPYPATAHIREDAARKIGLGLLALLGLALIIHATLFSLALAGMDATSKMSALRDMVDRWLFALTGLTASAVAFYFVRQRK